MAELQRLENILPQTLIDIMKPRLSHPVESFRIQTNFSHKKTTVTIVFDNFKTNKELEATSCSHLANDNTEKRHISIDEALPLLLLETMRPCLKYQVGNFSLGRSFDTNKTTLTIEFDQTKPRSTLTPVYYHPSSQLEPQPYHKEPAKTSNQTTNETSTNRTTLTVDLDQTKTRSMLTPLNDHALIQAEARPSKGESTGTSKDTTTTTIVISTTTQPRDIITPPKGPRPLSSDSSATSEDHSTQFLDEDTDSPSSSTSKQNKLFNQPAQTDISGDDSYYDCSDDDDDDDDGILNYLCHELDLPLSLVVREYVHDCLDFKWSCKSAYSEDNLYKISLLPQNEQEDKSKFKLKVTHLESRTSYPVYIRSLYVLVEIIEAKSFIRHNLIFPLDKDFLVTCAAGFIKLDGLCGLYSDDSLYTLCDLFDIH